jgi:hypothetical protein
MNKVWRVFSFYMVFYMVLAAHGSAQQPIEAREARPSAITHVATALDHLTVLEFGDPVVMAAAGSSAFQIERHENRVFVKPLKPGVSTNLFVWTASARFNYELDAPGEVKTMNFAVDNAVAPPKPPADNVGQLAQVADLLLTRAFLGSERVDSSSVKNGRNSVTVRVERVLRTKNGTYIHYRVENRDDAPYRVSTPAVYRLKADHLGISLVPLVNAQLSAGVVSRLGKTAQIPIPVAHAEVQREDVRPGEDTQGVIAIREPLESPVAVQLVFGSDRGHPVLATLVL